MQNRTAFAIVSLCMFAMPAMATDEDTGFYVGANALSLLSTYRRNDLDSATTTAFSGVDSTFAMGPSSVQRAHVSWDVNFGYMVTRNFGVEVSFIDLGPFRYSGFGTGTSPTDGSPAEVHLKLDTRTHGPAVSLVGALPMTNLWELDARVGALFAKTKSSYESTVGDSTNNGNLSESSTSLMASVGTAFTVTTHIVLRMDYLRIQHIKEKALDRAYNVDGLTAGIAYVF